MLYEISQAFLEIDASHQYDVDSQVLKIEHVVAEIAPRPSWTTWEMPNISRMALHFWCRCR